ncbi:MAG: T9SS type A sorting domain-containing protein [Bacteroidota bacterium]
MKPFFQPFFPFFTAAQNASLLLLCLAFSLSAQGQVEWATQSQPAPGAGGSAKGNDVVVDSQGNSYVVGDYTGEIMIDTTFGDNFGSVYLAKFNPTGDLLWARYIKGSSNNDGIAVALNDSGHVYIAGVYTHTNNNTLLDFGQFTLTGNGEDNLFLAKADTAGTFIWGQSMVAENLLGGQFVRPTDIAVDAAGDILVIGEMNAPISIEGQMFNLNTYQNSNTAQFFYAKFLPNSDLAWFRFMEQENGGKYFLANHMNPASNGDMFMTGLMSDNGLRYGSDSLFHPGVGSDPKFVARFNSTNGDLLWYQTFSVQAQNQEAHQLGVDANDNVYTSMRLGGRIWLPDTNYFPTDLRGRYQLLKYSGAGERLWIKEIAYTDFPTTSGINEHSIAFTTQANGTSFLIGQFSGFTDWITFGTDSFAVKDPWTEGFTHFVAAYNSDGDYLDASTIVDEYLSASPGLDDWNTSAMSLGPQNHLFFTGNLEGTYKLGSDTLSAGALNHMLLVRLDAASLLKLSTPIESERPTIDLSLYPNPNQGTLTVSFAEPSKAQLKLYDMEARLVAQWSLDAQQQQLDLSSLINGIYFLTIENKQARYTSKLILER